MSALKKQKRSATPKAPTLKPPAAVDVVEPTRALRSHAKKANAKSHPPPPPPKAKVRKSRVSASALDSDSVPLRRSPRLAVHHVEEIPLSSASSSSRKRERSSSPVLKKDKAKAAEHTHTSSSKAEHKDPKEQDMYAFYNNCAGQSQIPGAELDQHGNAQGIDYDLARDGAFAGFRILIGQFCTYYPRQDEERYANRALRAKGFTVDWVHNEAAFCSSLKNFKYEVAWVVSSCAPPPSPALLEVLTQFHESGGGLLLFGDNDPYNEHVNPFLEARFKTKLVGNFIGTQKLQYQPKQYNAKGRFGDHFIFTGIQALYEGHTISHPTTVSPPLTTLATASDGNPCVVVYDPIATEAHSEASSSSSSSSSSTSTAAAAAVAGTRLQGRVVIDCGFTKLYHEWEEAGAARYIVNASCWLVGIEKNAKC